MCAIVKSQIKKSGFDGTTPLVQKLCDGTLSLPMAADCGGVDSFNVSVAAGMLLYEIDRQRALRAEKE